MRMEELFPLKKFDGTLSENWIKDLGDFKKLGLIKIFNKLDHDISQSISDSYRQQKIAKTNRLSVKLKKLFIINLMDQSKEKQFNELHFNGYTIFPIDSESDIVKHCVSEIKKVSENNIKEGYQLEATMNLLLI